MKRMAKRDASVAKFSEAPGEGLNNGEGVMERARRGARVRGVAQVKLAEPQVETVESMRVRTALVTIVGYLGMSRMSRVTRHGVPKP